MSKEETRQIILKGEYESGHYGFGTISIEAEAGRAETVSRDEARLAVNGGFFEYAGDSLADAAPTKQSLMKLSKDELVKQAIDEFRKTATDESVLPDFENLTKDKLSDYISTPALRDTIVAPPTETAEMTGAAGGANVSAVQAAQLSGVLVANSMNNSGETI